MVPPSVYKVSALFFPFKSFVFIFLFMFNHHMALHKIFWFYIYMYLQWWEPFQTFFYVLLCCDLVVKKRGKKKKKENRFGFSHVSGGGHSRSLHFLGSVLRVIFLFQQFLTVLVQEADAEVAWERHANLQNWDACCVFLPAVYPALHLKLRHLNGCTTK